MSKTKSNLVITVPEAGERLGLSRGSAYEAVKRGELPVIRIGRLLRVPVVALERMLERADEQSAEQPKRAAGGR